MKPTDKMAKSYIWLRNTEKSMLFDVFEIYFDLMTLDLKLYLDIMVTYFYTKNKSIGHSVQKLLSGKTDRQTSVKLPYCVYTITFPKPCLFTNLLYVLPIDSSSLVSYFLGGGGGTSPNNELQDTLPTDCRLLSDNPSP